MNGESYTKHAKVLQKFPQKHERNEKSDKIATAIIFIQSHIGAFVPQ